MNLEEVKQLISIINDSEIRNFELSIDNVSVKMSKNDNVNFTASAQPSVPVQTTQSVPQKAETVTEIPVEKETKKAEVKGGNLVKAPIVGTFYGSPAPGKPNFAEVGKKVKKGDVLCIIEAMKIMNEVVSEFDGEVAEILVENEQLVEYGQPLFRIV